MSGDAIPEREFASWVGQVLNIPPTSPYMLYSKIVKVHYILKFEAGISWEIDLGLELSFVLENALSRQRCFNSVTETQFHMAEQGLTFIIESKPKLYLKTIILFDCEFDFAKYFTSLRSTVCKNSLFQFI